MKQETANYGGLGGKCPAQDAETSGQIETVNETKRNKMDRKNDIILTIGPHQTTSRGLLDRNNSETMRAGLNSDPARASFPALRAGLGKHSNKCA